MHVRCPRIVRLAGLSGREHTCLTSTCAGRPGRLGENSFPAVPASHDLIPVSHAVCIYMGCNQSRAPGSQQGVDHVSTKEKHVTHGVSVKSVTN
eukprot:6174228-Pleurochrysis_carterae.AAC.2